MIGEVSGVPLSRVVEFSSFLYLILIPGQPISPTLLLQMPPGLKVSGLDDDDFQDCDPKQPFVHWFVHVFIVVTES